MSIYNTLMNACVRAEIFGPRPQSIRSAYRIHRSTVDIGWREPKGSPAAAVRIYGCRSTASRHRARAPHSCLVASMIAVSRSREVSLYSTPARSTRDYLDNPRIVPQKSSWYIGYSGKSDTDFAWPVLHRYSKYYIDYGPLTDSNQFQIGPPKFSLLVNPPLASNNGWPTLYYRYIRYWPWATHAELRYAWAKQTTGRCEAFCFKKS